MTSFIHPFVDDDRPLIWLAKVAVAVVAGIVLSHFGIPRLPDNLRF